MNWRNLAGTIVIVLMFAGCNDQERKLQAEPEILEDQEQDQENQNPRALLDAVEQDPDLGTFAAALNSWNIEDTLQEVEADFTVFAPDNMAYSQIYQDHGKELLEANAEDVVAYHLVRTSGLKDIRSRFRSGEDSLRLQTLQGEEVTLAMANDTLVLIGGSGEKARVTDSLQGPDGMVYIIDSVLLPGSIDKEVVITAEE